MPKPEIRHYPNYDGSQIQTYGLTEAQRAAVDKALKPQPPSQATVRCCSFGSNECTLSINSFATRLSICNRAIDTDYTITVFLPAEQARELAEKLLEFVEYLETIDQR